MTIRQKSQQYVDEQLAIVDPELSKAHYHRHTKMGMQRFTGSDIEQAYEEGSYFVIEELEVMLQNLREKNQTLWTRSALEDKLNELKGE